MLDQETLREHGLHATRAEQPSERGDSMREEKEHRLHGVDTTDDDQSGKTAK